MAILKKQVIIMGAAGRDFHDFNVYFRENPYYEVVAFTAAQIPGIAGRRYPPRLAGKLYPRGIPIFPEERLEELISKYGVEQVVLAYSDLPYREVMSKSAMVEAAGADFRLLGPGSTMIRSKRKVIAVCAVRTGCGKSSTTFKICELLKKAGKRFVVVRHPMPYGDLEKQEVQRYATLSDLERHECTIEEREEYEPHIRAGHVLYAGVDYGKILRLAEKEADVIVWDGGNNDFSFYRPDLLITIADPHRPGHEISYYPGEVNARMADVLIINKEKTASQKNVETVRANLERINPRALMIDADSEITCKQIPKNVRSVLVVEDGPTLTHGGMRFGAGTIAAQNAHLRIADPRKHAVGSIREVYQRFRHLGALLPAMGYSPEQLADLEATINATPADAVINASPERLEKLIKINKPVVEVTYRLKEIAGGTLEQVLKEKGFI